MLNSQFVQIYLHKSNSKWVMGINYVRAVQSRNRKQDFQEEAHFPSLMKTPKYIYVYICVCMCKHIYIYTYEQFSLHVTLMYVFRADGLALDNQLVCSSLGGPPLLLSTSSVAYSFLCRIEASWDFLFLVWHVYWCHL